METLPKEIINAILSYVVEDLARRQARVVCRAWDAIINYSHYEITCAVTPENVDQLRDTFMKITRPFSLLLGHARLLSAIDRLLDPLTHMTALDYPSMLPMLSRVTNLQRLIAYSAPAELLLRQPNLTRLTISEVTGGRHLLLPDSLSSIQTLAIHYLLADPILAAVTPTNLTSLSHITTKPFEISKFSNLKTLFLRGKSVIDLNLPNLEELRINPPMRVYSTRLTHLTVFGANDALLDIAPSLTTLKLLTGGWINDSDQLAQFTALKHLEELHITTSPSMKVLKYVQPNKLKRLQMLPSTDSIEDIAHLSTFTNLHKLKMTFYSDIDMMVLAPLTKLDTLELTYNVGINVQAITTMTRLQVLSLQDKASSVRATINLQALSRLNNLRIASKSTRLNNVSAVTELEHLQLNGNLMDFDQLDGAHLTHLDVSHYNDTLWQSLTRMTGLEELCITDLHHDNDVIALSILTTLTFLSASHSTNNGKELTRLTSLRYLQYISEGNSTAVKEVLIKKLVKLTQCTYVV